MEETRRSRRWHYCDAISPADGSSVVEETQLPLSGTNQYPHDILAKNKKKAYQRIDIRGFLLRLLQFILQLGRIDTTLPKILQLFLRLAPPPTSLLKLLLHALILLLQLLDPRRLLPIDLLH